MSINKRLKVDYYTILKERLSLKVLEGSLSFRQYIPIYFSFIHTFNTGYWKNEKR